MIAYTLPIELAAARLLRNDVVFNAINNIPHAEDRLKGAPRSTHNMNAAVVGNFFHTLFRRNGV